MKSCRDAEPFIVARGCHRNLSDEMPHVGVDLDRADRMLPIRPGPGRNAYASDRPFIDASVVRVPGSARRSQWRGRARSGSGKDRSVAVPAASLRAVSPTHCGHAQHQDHCQREARASAGHGVGSAFLLTGSAGCPRKRGFEGRLFDAVTAGGGGSAMALHGVAGDRVGRAAGMARRDVPCRRRFAGVAVVVPAVVVAAIGIQSCIVGRRHAGEQRKCGKRGGAKQCRHCTFPGSGCVQTLPPIASRRPDSLRDATLGPAIPGAPGDTEAAGLP